MQWRQAAAERRGQAAAAAAGAPGRSVGRVQCVPLLGVLLTMQSRPSPRTSRWGCQVMSSSLLQEEETLTAFPRQTCRQSAGLQASANTLLPWRHDSEPHVWAIPQIRLFFQVRSVDLHEGRQKCVYKSGRAARAHNDDDITRRPRDERVRSATGSFSLCSAPPA